MTSINLDRAGVLYARIAIGAAFLSAVASRFGVWDGNIGLEHFAGFTRYTAEVNAFMPAATVPFLAWAATVAETLLGLALVTGIRLHWVALGSAIVLAVFGTAMAISFGLKSPLDYSVYSASAGALLLSRTQAARGKTSGPDPTRPAWWARLPRLKRVDGLATGVIGLH